MKVLFIGIGHLGSSLIKGINSQPSEYEVYGYHYDKQKLHKLGEKLNFQPVENLVEINKKQITVVVVSVRVESLNEVLEKLDDLDLSNVTIVSTISGVDIETIKQRFIKNNEVRIARVMPNINAENRLSTTGLATNISDQFRALQVKHLFEQVGSVFEIEESQFSNFTIAAGSMPAYALYFVDEFIWSAVRNGMNLKLAKKVITDVFIKTINNWNLSDSFAKTIIDHIATPNGVTIEGIEVLQKAKTGKTISKAYQKALNKDKQNDEEKK